MGLDVYLYNGSESVEEPSLKYPEHGSNRGYLRSSYNSGGYNSVVGSMTGKDMYYIFEPIDRNSEDDDEESSWYVRYPKEHLEGALERANEVLEELKTRPAYKAASASAQNAFGKKDTAKQSLDEYGALQLVYSFLMSENREPSEEFEAEFHFEDPYSVVAIITGKGEQNEACIHYVYKSGSDEYKVHTVSAVRPEDSIAGPEKDVDQEKALEIFFEHKKKHVAGKSGFSSYSCSEGSFFFDEPLEVSVFVPGEGYFKDPCVYAIFAFDPEYYIQQTEIIIEFIEHALSLDDPRIGWSG